MELKGFKLGNVKIGDDEGNVFELTPKDKIELEPPIASEWHHDIGVVNVEDALSVEWQIPCEQGKKLIAYLLWHTLWWKQLN